MSPTALDAPGHHDSFALPRESEQVKVHSSAKRSPEGGLITVESEDVVYDESEIRAKYTDRGAHVTSKLYVLLWKYSHITRTLHCWITTFPSPTSRSHLPHRSTPFIPNTYESTSHWGSETC